MGPPLERWREPVAVFRHGHPRNAEMRTQIVQKAPKWTFSPKYPEPSYDRHKDMYPGPKHPEDHHRDDFSKYKRDPAWTISGNGNGSNWDRPSSAPPGGVYVPLKPSTPRWSFGTSRRTPPAADTPGPGPGGAYVPDTPRGVKVSLTPRRPMRTRTTEGPGPACYTPRDHIAGRWGHWGHVVDSKTPQETGPGPKYDTRRPSMGPRYSMGARRAQSVEKHHADRELGPPFTHFGYNDFGH
jgi:hypothetical protein